MTGRQIPNARVYAELPSGAFLAPRSSADGCPGPDVFGTCPLAETTNEIPCAGAIWHYTGEQHWRFEFDRASATCPAAVLDPLG
jgi:hypothetical protein